MCRHINLITIASLLTPTVEKWTSSVGGRRRKIDAIRRSIDRTLQTKKNGKQCSTKCEECQKFNRNKIGCVSNWAFQRWPSFSIKLETLSKKEWKVTLDFFWQLSLKDIFKKIPVIYSTTFSLALCWKYPVADAINLKATNNSNRRNCWSCN